jgi:hypothetical protein
MSARTFLITAGVLGGGYYLYNSRLDAAHHSGQSTLPYRSGGEGPAEHAGRQVDESVLRAREKANDLRADANRKIDGTLGSYEREKSNVASWASDKLQSTKDSLDDHASAADQRARQFEQSATGKDNKGRLEKIEQGVKEEWNELKQKRDTWFKDSGSEREIELALETKKSLEGWGESAAQNASEYYDSLISTTTKATSKPDAAYKEAQRLFDEAQKRFNETKSSWLSFTVDEEKKRAHAEAQRHLEYTQKRLDDASAKFNDWKKSASDSSGASVGGPKKYNGFYDWLRGGVPYQDEGNEASDARHNVQSKGRHLKKQASKTADEWSQWFSKTYEDTAQGARDFYDDANDALNDAQKQLDSTTKHWWEVWKSTSKDVQLQAKTDVEEAQKRVTEASNGLVKWGENVNKNFWNGAESAVDRVKSGLDTTNDKTQQGLNDAKIWIAEQN